MKSVRVRSRLAAWLLVIAGVLLATWLAIAGLSLLARPVPTGLDAAHGVIVALRGNSLFEARVTDASGHVRMLWFRVTPGSPISVDHLLRHQREHAATDIEYREDAHGTLWAWVAD